MKPLLALDIETTGLNITQDHIIQVGLYSPFEVEREWLIQPPVPIPPEIEELTGITNDRVKDCPQFGQVADEIHESLAGKSMMPADLLVFNGYSFDVPFLYEEFARAGIEWDLTGVEVIDVGNIFKRKEERTLSAAVKFYCGREHVGAHGALSDCEATFDVASRMALTYPDLNTFMSNRGALAHYSRYDEDRLSFDGKIIQKDGEAYYNFGKCKGVRVKDDPGYGEWMLRGDFPAQTKNAVRKALNT